MSLAIRRLRKHRAIDAVTHLRDENWRILAELDGANRHSVLLEHGLAVARRDQAQAEQVVVCLDDDLRKVTDERNRLVAALTATRALLAPYLAAEANAGAVTVPRSVRDTAEVEDQATVPIDVRPLWAALHPGPVVASSGNTSPAHIPAATG